MAMDERGLGKRLQQARKTAGLTQQELCHRASLSFSTLTKIERGAIKAPSIFTIMAIADTLQLGLDELVGNAVPTEVNRHYYKTKSGVSFVYFDVNGCLVRFFQRAFIQLALDSGAPSDRVETAFWHFNAEVCRGTMSVSDFNEQFAARLGVDSVDWQKYYIGTIEPIDQMQEALRWASERYRVGLLTNIMPGFLSIMRRNHQLPDLPYDAVIDSSEVAAIKPEARIYEIAQERAGVDPGEILLIDDSRANLMAAEQFGWNVLWFDDSRPEESVERVREALQPAD
jgi:FMN phosphatase YigB (HAD superfamily)/DNA-binding XRE family transcriptional regulator